MFSSFAVQNYKSDQKFHKLCLHHCIFNIIWNMKKDNFNFQKQKLYFRKSHHITYFD